MIRMLRPLSVASSLALVVFVSGCGGTTDSAVATAPAVGRHGVPAVALPGGSGFVEVVIEPAGTGAAARSSKVRVAAYVFDADLKPLPAGSATVDSVQVKFPDGNTATAKLAADPRETGRFVSEPGDYAVEPLSGDITATIGGTAETIPFANPR
jgi:hypothetical protein